MGAQLKGKGTLLHQSARVIPAQTRILNYGHEHDLALRNSHNPLVEE